MYIPVFKYRDIEKRTLRKMNQCISKNIFPLIEIIKDEYKTVYKIDPFTNDYVYENKNGRNYRQKEDPTDNDICTLENISNLTDNRQTFIDFLRINPDKYNGVDYSKLVLSLRLRDFSYYKKRLKEVCKFNNLIPVISLQLGYEDSIDSVSELIDELKTECGSIAFRVTYEVYQNYKSIIQKLNTNDFFILDIGEIDASSLFMEYDELNTWSIKAKKVVVHCPRKSVYSNKDFEEHDRTNLINTEINTTYSDYGFDGFGDYCGYKDTLPSSPRGNFGSAICLMYDSKNNQFWSFTNKNTKLGSSGFPLVKQRVLSYETVLNPNGDCPAYDEIKNMGGSGSYKTWIEIGYIRYLDQLSKIV